MGFQPGYPLSRGSAGARCGGRTIVSRRLFIFGDVMPDFLHPLALARIVKLQAVVNCIPARKPFEVGLIEAGGQVLDTRSNIVDYIIFIIQLMKKSFAGFAVNLHHAVVIGV